MMPRFWNTLKRGLFVKKRHLLVLGGLLLAGSLVALPADNEYVSKYENIGLDFLRSHYFEINNARPIQVTGYFSSYQWLSPFQYEERLHNLGFSSSQFNILQFTLREVDPFYGKVQEGKNPQDYNSVHYSFPILLFPTQAGELKELDELQKGDRVIVYGQFYNLEKSEYAIEVHLIETVKKGGHDRDVLIDCRVEPTLTPTPTITATPGPDLWQKMMNKVNPKETATPLVTTTPGT